MGLPVPVKKCYCSTGTCTGTADSTQYHVPYSSSKIPQSPEPRAVLSPKAKRNPHNQAVLLPGGKRIAWIGERRGKKQVRRQRLVLGLGFPVPSNILPFEIENHIRHA